MPKIVNKRFRTAARKAADPLNIVDEQKQQIFTPSEQVHLHGLNENDLFNTIKERLKSPMPSERCVGTDMVSTFVTDKRFSNFKPEQIDELLKILGALLLDRAENVRYGSVDALCYLSTLSDDICERIIANKVIRSLLLMLETYFGSINFQDPKVTDRKLTLNLYSDTFNLLSYCSESSSKCLEELLANNKLQKIFHKAISAAQTININDNETNNNIKEKDKKFNFSSISIAATECLTVLVEDSRLFRKLLIDKENGDEQNDLSVIIQNLIDLSINETMLEEHNSIIYLHILAIYVGSTVLREIPDIGQNNIEKLVEKLSKIMNSLINYDLEPKLTVLLEKIKNHGKSTTFGQLQEMQQLQNFSNLIFKSKRCIFELLINILSIGDNDDETMNNGDDDEDIGNDNDDIVDDIVDDIQMDISQSCDPTIQCDNFILKFIHDNKVTDILQRELDKYLSISNETIEILKSQFYGQELLKCIESTIVSILTLFINLIQNKIITNFDFIGNSVCQILFSTTNNISFSSEIIGESSNVLREILQNNRSNVSNIIDIQKLEEIERFFDISKRFQLNFIKICSIIALSLIENKQTTTMEEVINHVEKITKVLMALYDKYFDDLIFKAEILDSLIDIFSDDNQITLAVMRNVGLIEFLKKNQQSFRSEAKCQRQLCRDNAVVGTVALNLRRFINYKQKLC